MFEVALANVKTLKDMIKILVMATNIDVKDIPGVTYYRTNNFEIEFLDPPKTSWCIDGEEYKSENLIEYKLDLIGKFMGLENMGFYEGSKVLAMFYRDFFTDEERIKIKEMVYEYNIEEKGG